MPHSAHSRPIPLIPLRNQVCEQLQAMLKDGILGEWHICLDARKIKKQMVTDRMKVMPSYELMQKLYGAKYESCFFTVTTRAIFKALESISISK